MPLIGREREAVALRAALVGAPCVVYVAGEAGVGKSALVAEAVPGARVVRCGAGPMDAAVLSGPAPVVVEDLQWADTVTLRLLRDCLAEPPAALRLLLLYRPEELAVPGLPLGEAGSQAHTVSRIQLDLAPLTPADVTAWSGLPEEEARSLHEAGAGLPHVLADLLQAPAAAAATTRTACHLLAAGAPPRLTQLTLDRFSALDPDTQAVVQAAAVLGEAADEKVLAAVAGLPAEQAQTALLTALAGRLLAETPQAGYGCHPPLAARALLDQLPGPVRRKLHSRAAEALARLPRPVPLAQVARHHRAAGSTKAWLRTAEAAADRAVQHKAPDPQSAAELLREALATEGLPQATEVRLARKLAQVAGHLSGLDDTTHALLERLINSERLPLGIRGELRRDLALLLVNQGANPQQGLVEMAHAVDELSGRPEPAVRAMVALAMPFLTGVAVAENLRWLERAQAAADRSGDPELKLMALAGRVSLAAEIGDREVWPLARELAAAHALGGVRRIEVLRGLCNAADGVAWLGHYDQADRFIRHALQLASRVGAEFNADLTKGTALRIDWGRGNWSDLENRATALAARNPLSPARPEAHLVAGQLALARGDWSAARHQLRAAGLIAPDNGAAPVITAAAGVLLRGLLDRGELVQARRGADAAWRRLRTKGVWVWGTELVPSYVELLARAGEWTAAERAVAQFAEGVEDRDAPLAAAALRLCRALLDRYAGRMEQAETGFREAAEQYAAIPQPYDAAHALERAGHCALDTQRFPEQLVRAEREFDLLGATSDAARCGAALQRRGLAGPSVPRRGRPAYGSQLSPREREVALLAAQGRTNAEIAAALVLSPRTVEQHIGKALRKLSLTSRTELTSALTAQSW